MTELSIEKRIEALEKSMKIVKSALMKLNEWMDTINDVSTIDTKLFKMVNERILALEVKSVD